jgi:tryptophanyl-tRNA synthetase
MASQPEAPTAEVPPTANPDVANPPTTKQNVDPWNVSGEIGEDGKLKAIDYKKLVEEFGTKLIDQELLDRFERITGHKPHRFLRRQIVFSQRDFEVILDRYEKVYNNNKFICQRQCIINCFRTGRAILLIHWSWP